MPSDVRYAEVQKLLESHGWTCSRIKGSHHVFTKTGERPIVISVHRHKVKYFYVHQHKKKLEEDRRQGS